jgi:glycosyltransferase involved in cell wall biosynthesis
VERPLRICLVSEEFPTGRIGGIGTYTAVLARGLAELGHRVHAIVRSWDGEGVDDRDGVRVHRLTLREPAWRRGTRFLLTRLYTSREILLWNLRVCETVRRIAATDGVDVVESPDYHAQALLTALRERRIPLVVRLHGPAYLFRRSSGRGIGWSRLDTAVCERLEYHLARRAALLVASSPALVEVIARDWRLSAASIRLIPLPIDDDVFDPPPNGSRDAATILYAGRVSRSKGVDVLVEALPSILGAFPQARVRIVGRDHPSGPDGSSMREHLRARLRHLSVPDDAVEMVGVADRASMPDEYRRATVCVIPSPLGSSGYSCLEAMACGCPVVATSVAGRHGAIEDGETGLLVPSARPDALAAAVARVLADADLQLRLADRAAAVARERFGRLAICGETARAYASLVRT